MKTLLVQAGRPMGRFTHGGPASQKFYASKDTDQNEADARQEAESSGSWQCSATAEGTALHIVRNKTLKMLYLPGDFIADVLNRVWGY